MSHRATDWALKCETGKSLSKCVLLVLACHADKDDDTCFPSQELIAQEAGMSVDSVQRRLKELEADGFIVRQRRYHPDGKRTSDLYTLQIEAKPQTAVLPGAQTSLEATESPGLSRNPNEPKPQLCGLHIEPSLEPSVKQFLLRRDVAEGLARRSFIRRLHSDPPDDGLMELQIAERIGPLGFRVLGELPGDEVEHLCSMQRRGILNEEKISELRSKASW